MYLSKPPCNGCKKGGLKSLGIWGELLSAGMQAFGSGGSDSGAGGAPMMPSNVVSTSTNVNTQVSPQISPNFIQQQQPQNSAVNASATMGTPVTGNIPGIDYGSLPTEYSSSGGMTDTQKLLLGGSVMVLIGALLLGRKKGAGRVS